LGTYVVLLIQQQYLSLVDFHELFKQICVRCFRYSISELKHSNEYIVSLKILVCTEEGKACDLTVNVLNNHVLNREDCDWHAEFFDPGNIFFDNVEVLSI